MAQTFWNRIKKGFPGDSPAHQGFGLSDPGRRRRHNEDAFFVSDALGLYVVADGMGGHAHGEVASRLAVESVSERFSFYNGGKTSIFLTKAVQEANRLIYRQSEEAIQLEERETPGTRMGTTIVALAIRDHCAVIAHVGDSRLYRMRACRLLQLTRDHSLSEFAPSQGNAPPVMLKKRFKHLVTRALGLEADIEVELREETLQKGDLFLLCSDGLTNMISDNQIADILSCRKMDQSVCEALIKAANEHGGDDNISCVLVAWYG